jgi:hypothetical protein
VCVLLLSHGETGSSGRRIYHHWHPGHLRHYGVGAALTVLIPNPHPLFPGALFCPPMPGDLLYTHHLEADCVGPRQPLALERELVVLTGEGEGWRKCIWQLVCFL